MPEHAPEAGTGQTGSHRIAHRIGLAGAGRMARALARGWQMPVLCTDAGSGRSAALAAEVGGEAVADNAELAKRSDLVVLCHKPAQLAAVAAELDGLAPVVVSILSGITVAELRGVYRRSPVMRVTVNLPVEVRAGVISIPSGQDIGGELQERIVRLFTQLGTVILLPEEQVAALIALAGVGPALLSVFAEAQADAAIQAGLPAELATRLCTEAMRGTAALLAEIDHDTLALRRAVASPGGTTARSLTALEAGGLRQAVLAASLAARSPSQ